MKSRGVHFLTVLVALCLVGVGQSSASSTSVFSVECQKEHMVPKLASTCRNACNNPDDLTFLSPALLKSCQKILVEKNPKDLIKVAKRTAPQKSTPENDLERCLRKAGDQESIADRIERRIKVFQKKMKKKSDRVRKRIEHKIGNLRASFPEFPTCTPSPQALKSLYHCLEIEAHRIVKIYDTLDQKGYRKKGVDICSIAGIEDDSISLEEVSFQFADLIEKFDNTDRCKIDVNKWNKSRMKQVCPAGSTAECKNRIQRFINSTDKELGKVQAQSDQVRSNIGNVKTNITAIDEIINQATAECN